MTSAPRDLGEFIRDLRRTAQISLRELADRAGVSNPYLSQIERGLRKPSAEVLQQIAGALRVSSSILYHRAGLLDPREGTPDVLLAIAADPDLDGSQKQTLIQIYDSFRQQNKHAAKEPAPETDPETSRQPGGDDAAEPAVPPAEL
nr:helix-turn-helix domain-containing protein [Longispora albida]